MITRKGFFGAAAAGLAALGVPGGRLLPAATVGSLKVKASGAFVVDDIERVTVRVPYRPIPQRAMNRELPHWRYSEIFEVTLCSGRTGLGEALL